MRTVVVYLVIGYVFLYFLYGVNCGFLKKGEVSRVELVDIRNCDGSSNKLRFYPSLSRFNRTNYGLSMVADLAEPFDAKFSIDAELQAWRDGGWKRNFLHVNHNNACNTLILLLGEPFKKMMVAGGIPPRCPVAAGYYKFSNMSFALDNIPFLVQEGKFRAYVNLLKRKEIYCCVYLELNCKIVLGF